MQLRQNWLVWLTALALATGGQLGCGGGEVVEANYEEEPAEEFVEAAAEIKRRTADTLPAVGDSLPPLDSGRVQLAPPNGWNVLARDPKYLARFVPGKANDLPRVVVIAVDSPFPDLTTVTEENVAEFAERMAEELARDKRKRVLEAPKPIILGDKAWARHVRQVGSDAALQSLQTLSDGRLYSVELTLPVAGESREDLAEAMQQHRDSGYTVAANMKFLKEGGAEADTESSFPVPAIPKKK